MKLANVRKTNQTVAEKQNQRIGCLEDVLKNRVQPVLSNGFVNILQGSVIRVIRAKGKQREQMQSMKHKYIFAKHALPHYFDPVTGILRRKEEYNNYR